MWILELKGLSGVDCIVIIYFLIALNSNLQICVLSF